jgi:hypothetical protein
MDGAQLLFFFAGHAHPGQGIAIALDETVQPQTERLGIEPIGLYPLIALIQLLRTDHVALHPKRSEPALQSKTNPHAS